MNFEASMASLQAEHEKAVRQRQALMGQLQQLDAQILKIEGAYEYAAAIVEQQKKAEQPAEQVAEASEAIEAEAAAA